MSIYGNPVTLGPRWMTAQKVSILPYQNLHGYDHPWPAGGGKNLLPLTVSLVKASSTSGTWSGDTYTVNGVIYTLFSNSDGVITKITATGTASADASLVLSRNTSIADGTYILSGCPNGGSYSRYRLYSVSPNTTDLGTGGTISISNNTPAFAIVVYKNYAINGSLTFMPMLRLSTVADSTFEPYSNICLISGWEDCRIWVSPTPNPADGTTYQTLFGNPPGTVYGGEFDLTTGVLTVDRSMVDLGTQTWSYSSSNAFFYANLYNAKMPLARGGNPTGCCSSYRLVSTPGTNIYNQLPDKSIAYCDIGYSSSPRVLVKDTSYLDVSVFEAAMSGVQLVYEIDTPITYQLTPQQISFLGNQYFGASCGPVLIKVGK